MDDAEEWELTPHHRVEELKKEVDKLKKNPFGDSGSGENVLQAIERLDHSIHELMQIFKMAQEDMSSRENVEDPKYKELSEKIDRLADENRKIAQGIVSLAGIVRRDPTPPPQSSAPQPLMNPGEMNPPPFIQPRSSVPPPSPPPQTPGREERKSLFDKFKG
ncbi:hypothetical protein HQ529_01080 [Candidatus Woesearchaeota archaeon]|nr:hypothetical protein [Candidatus Woesearchaeota archaeon]